MALREHVSCGLDFTFSPDLNNSLDLASRTNYDFISVPLFNSRYKREFIEGPTLKRKGPLTRSDMLLSSKDWSSLVVAKISPWINTDSTNDVVRTNSQKAFKQELHYASHLSVPAILIPLQGPDCANLTRILNEHVTSGYNHQVSVPGSILIPLQGPDCANLTRILNEHITSGYNHQYWVRVPLKSSWDQRDDCIEGEENLDRDTHDTWTWWNTVRTLSDTHKRINVALEVTADLPANDVIERWCGEPVKALILPTNIFLTNRKGFPVLSRAHQSLVKRLYRLDTQVIVTGADRHNDKGVRAYQQYLDHLWQTQEPLDNVEMFAKGYEDYLQCPLQPLKDNLESQTYEVFEKDPIKYSQYQKAVYHALLDRISAEEKDTKVLTLMVLGAGRGPLVTASITAANKADRKIKVYAVEKNPNAIITLENLKYEMWGDQVTVVSSDMREWDAPEKADIIVSELLGSFGDNELSPECLDGAQKFLKEDGISIPKEYTSYIAPLSSCKLWNEARICKDPGKVPEAPLETPYVVRLHNVNLLAKPQPLFTFTHPNYGVIDNGRYGVREFNVAIDSILHGFAGYFDCILYGDVTLSIVPETHSPGMFSWFPLYIPIREPMLLHSGETLVVHMWRLCTEKSVWYEWCTSAPQARPIHNPKGRSVTIDL